MHYDKFTKREAAAIFKHCARENENYSNENIDRTKTSQNYNLGPQGNQWAMMERKLSQLSYRKQKNNIVLCGWVVTVPENVKPEDREKFIQATYDFLEKKYKKENVVSCYVHRDEKNDHLHFLFVPGIDGKLSASKLTDRVVLQNIHDDLQKEIDRTFGHHEYLVRSDDPEERAKGSVPVEKFKKAMKSLEDKIELLKIDCDYFEQKAKQLQNVVHSYEEKISSLKKDVEQQKGYVSMYKELVKAYKGDKEKIQQEIKDFKEELQKQGEMFNKYKKINLERLESLSERIEEMTQRTDDLQTQVELQALQQEINQTIEEQNQDEEVL